MKVYEKPTFDYIEIRPEERLAVAASCIEYGSCEGKEGDCVRHWYNSGPE